MKKIFFFIFLTICFSLSSQIYSTGTETLLPGLTANIEINGNTFITKLTLAGPSDVWLAIGFGNSEMNGTDIFMTDGNTIRDAYSEPGPSSSLERPVPPQDSPSNESGDWNLISNTVSSDTRTIVATRLNNTQDSNDYIFNASEGSLSIIYAYGGTSMYAWHGPENRGATVLNVNTLGDYENTLLSFEMYPNPVSNLLTIQLPVNTEKTEVSILDLTGRLVKTKTTTTNDTSIDVQKISNGIYVVKVATRDKIGVKKFIKK
tara:strand:- start:3193 stop:3975 length:783 start_codon:yes stop_codon:yes gene_type:complete